MRERVSNGGQRTFQVLYRVDGRQTSTTFTAEKPAREFAAMVGLLGPERALAAIQGEAEPTLTVDALAEQWLAWKAASVQPRTLVDYRRDYRNWIKPTLGSRLASSVDERDVQRWVDSMRERLDPKSVADRHMLLHAMYRYGSARTRRLVEHNPCLETELPKRARKPVKGVTLPEYHALVTAARRVDPDAADLVEFIGGTGWRWSEAAALMVSAVETYDRPDGTSVVTARMSAVMRRGAKGSAMVTPDAAKSDAGFRTTRLPARVAAIVERRMVGRGIDDLVFTNGAGRRWHQQNFLARTWPRIEAEAGIGRHITPHALRHAHVAMLDRAGASLAQTQRRIGHGSIETTIGVYGGMITDIDDGVLSRVDVMLDPAPAVQTVAGEVVTAARPLTAGG